VYAGQQSNTPLGYGCRGEIVAVQAAQSNRVCGNAVDSGGLVSV